MKVNVIRRVVVSSGPVGGYLRALRDELRGVELGHHALQHLVDDGGQHALVVVLPQLLVQGGQVGGQRPRQHAQRDVHHLEEPPAGGAPLLPQEPLYYHRSPLLEEPPAGGAPLLPQEPPAGGAPCWRSPLLEGPRYYHRSQSHP
ncbi:hypothetical protein EYF80_056773 [Liparis tanakae]|uniref:Uncharacterized protein n=1 Tax=Liparis tanakae TaxID=230148 RepID=A0A4Z2EXU0_9TELE|nr:hypothetical protein EYF80_056773 [Liparis tanakae]